MSAFSSSPSLSSGLSWRTILPGEPTTSTPSGKVLPSGMSAPAPTRQPLPMTAWFMMIAPIPMSVPSPIVQHCLVADGDVLAEGERNARIGVQDRGVLDVGALADGDDVAVASHDRVVPDARLIVQDHGADHGGVVRDEPLIAAECDFAFAQ